MSSSRQRNVPNSENATSSHENRTNGDVQKSKAQNMPSDTSKPTATSVAAAVFSPALITTFVLIFGGCCSNVYTLESILSLSPASGSLVTFLQFLLTALFTLPSQLTFSQRISPSPNSSHAPSRSLIPRLRTRSIPLYKWFMYTALFLTVNVLNNSAFNYSISVPLHIILRSAGPVTSICIGYLFMGRRYPARKIFAVLILFAGVVSAALSDASSKGKAVALDSSATQSELSKQIPGFILLASALVISAFMGIYTDDLYQQHGRSTAVTNENLFYSHLLSIPFFAAQYSSLQNQYLVVLSTATAANPQPLSTSKTSHLFSPRDLLSSVNFSQNPFVLLLANALTQIVCITGVNRLSTQTTSLTVSVVLNVRKLVSLLLSIWLFGNRLPWGVALGAALVFVGGGLYTLPSSTTGKSKKQQAVERRGDGEANDPSDKKVK